MQDEMNDLQYTREEDPDIIKVVRCKNCKSYESVPQEWCDLWEHFTEAEDYCSLGECNNA